MQSILVFITFLVAVSYLLRKFIWQPVFEQKKKSIATLDGNKTKCGKNNCGCH